MKETTSPPLRGRGLKLAHIRHVLERQVSPPLRGRGLKHHPGKLAQWWENFIPGVAYEQSITSICEKYLGFLQKIGGEMPIFIIQSLLEVRGYKMGVDGHSKRMSFAHMQVDRDTLLLPKIVLENYPDSNLPQILKPSFDMLWSAAGWPGQ